MRLTSIKDIITDKISGEWGAEAHGSQGVIVIRTANFLNSGKINFSNLVRREIIQKKIEKKKLLSGDIIIEKSGGSPSQPVGRVVFFENPDGDTYLCNNFTTVLRPNRNEAYPKFLFYLLHFNHKKGKTLRFQNKTTGIINLKLDSYLNSAIYLPPLNDQIRIAHLLGKVEGLIAQRKQHLQQLDELLKSVFLEMFGDPVENPHNFPVRRLSDFYINPKEGTKCGPFGSALKKDEYVDSGIPVWNMDNIDPCGRMLTPFRMWITKEKYNELSSYSVEDGDIIISRAGTVGKMCVAEMNGEPAIISTNLIRLRLDDKLTPLHVVSLMTHCKGRVGRLKVGADGAFTHMNTGILGKLEFPYPPKGKQNQFANIVKKVEALKTQYQQSLNDLESLYGALSQRAFKGELDLSRVPLPDVKSENEKAENQNEAVSTQPQGTPEQLSFGTLDEYRMSNPQDRDALLQKIFNDFLTDLQPNEPFNFDRFWQTVKLKSVDDIDEDSVSWNQKDYDHIKNWIFEALEKGDLKQALDDDNNRLQLTRQAKTHRKAKGTPA